MASSLQRPLALANTLKVQLSSGPIAKRSFHQLSSIRTQLSLPKTTSPFQSLKSSSRFRSTYRSSSLRTTVPTADAGPDPNKGKLAQRLLYAAGIFGGTVIVTNLVFNRETREDGGMPDYERSYLNSTFLHTGMGVGIIGIGARALHQSGWSIRMMAANPWLVVGGSLVASIGFMMGARAVSPDNYIPKYALWTGFNLTQAAILSPLMFMQPALLARAGLYTVAMMGSIAFVGATAKTDKYLYLGGPLLAGVAIVAVSGLAPLVLPVTATRTLMLTENLWLWGGLAVFGGFTLYDVQKILHHARLAERGMIPRDPVNESISLELDFLNIFIRMVQILGMSGNRRK